MFTGAQPFFYRRLSSPLHAARAPIAAAYGIALAVSALIVENPLLLGALLTAVIAAAAAAGVCRRSPVPSVRPPCRWC